MHLLCLAAKLVGDQHELNIVQGRLLALQIDLGITAAHDNITLFEPHPTRQAAVPRDFIDACIACVQPAVTLGYRDVAFECQGAIRQVFNPIRVGEHRLCIDLRLRQIFERRAHIHAFAIHRHSVEPAFIEIFSGNPVGTGYIHLPTPGRTAGGLRRFRALAFARLRTVTFGNRKGSRQTGKQQ